MNEVTTIGVDLAKNVFQVHGIDASGQVVARRQLRRSQVLPFFEKQALCTVLLYLSPLHYYEPFNLICLFYLMILTRFVNILLL